MKEAAEQAPDAFTEAVMARIEKQAAKAPGRTGLIPGRVWVWIAAWIGGLLGGGIYLGQQSGTAHPWWERLRDGLPAVDASLPLPELPVTAVWASLALLVCALLHLVWLRRYLSSSWAD